MHGTRKDILDATTGRVIVTHHWRAWARFSRASYALPRKKHIAEEIWKVDGTLALRKYKPWNKMKSLGINFILYLVALTTLSEYFKMRNIYVIKKGGGIYMYSIVFNTSFFWYKSIPLVSMAYPYHIHAKYGHHTSPLNSFFFFFSFLFFVPSLKGGSPLNIWI